MNMYWQSPFVTSTWFHSVDRTTHTASVPLGIQSMSTAESSLKHFSHKDVAVLLASAGSIPSSASWLPTCCATSFQLAHMKGIAVCLSVFAAVSKTLDNAANWSAIVQGRSLVRAFPLVQDKKPAL